MKYIVIFLIALFSVIIYFGFQENAEAREATEPCSYLDKNSYLKISSDPWQCMKVDYSVPEKCGKIAGLYKTDPECQPPKSVSIPTPSSTSLPSTKFTPSTKSPTGLNNPPFFMGLIFFMIFLMIIVNAKISNQKYGSYGNLPTFKQIRYLRRLGYWGNPNSSADASDAIQRMLKLRANGILILIILISIVFMFIQI